MKKQILIIIMCLLVSFSFVNAISDNAVKSVLQRILLEYFENSTNVNQSLTLPETIDLLEFYLSTNTSNVNLSVMSNSGRPIQNIYIKATTRLAQKDIDAGGYAYALGKVINGDRNRIRNRSDSCNQTIICDSGNTNKIVQSASCRVNIIPCENGCLNGACVNDSDLEEIDDRDNNAIIVNNTIRHNASLNYTNNFSWNHSNNYSMEFNNTINECINDLCLNGSIGNITVTINGTQVNRTPNNMSFECDAQSICRNNSVFHIAKDCSVSNPVLCDYGCLDGGCVTNPNAITN